MIFSPKNVLNNNYAQLFKIVVVLVLYNQIFFKMKTKWILVAFFMPLLMSTECERCERNVCALVILADLILDKFEANFVRTQIINSNNTAIYDILHAVLNTAKDVANCQSSVQTAGASVFSQDIYYSTNENFKPRVLVDSKQSNVNELPVGITGNVKDEIGFVQNGYYLFDSIVDYTGKVTERHEDNNNKSNVLQKSSIVDFSGKLVIHVTQANDGPIFDEKGRQIYLNRISSEVIYKKE